MAAKDATFHFRLPKDLREDVEIIAARERRTASQIVLLAVEEYVAREKAKAKRAR